MKGFLIGLVVGILFLPALAFLYVRLGYAPVATAAAPLPLERSFTHMAMHARAAKEAPKESPVPPSEENLIAGAQLYRQHCAVCHGTIAEPRTTTAKGMFPQPPSLFKGEGVTDDPVGETYWKAANGIRLSGMPAYKGTLTDEQLWQISQTVAHADKLPDKARELLAQPAPPQ
jgi:mono/diheme cytochrome c family protein